MREPTSAFASPSGRYLHRPATSRLIKPVTTRVRPASTASTPIRATLGLSSHSHLGSFETVARMPLASWNSVYVKPGHRAVTCTPRGATSSARHSLKRITDLFTEDGNEAFRALGYTIGGMMVFPGNRIAGKQTINGARGFHRKIADRFDLTLECIRRHYLGQPSPLGETLARYRDFFALFHDFRAYVEFFLLQDMVTDDGSAVRFFMPFDDFKTRSVPGDGDEYREYRRLSIEFIEARNRRIGQLPMAPQVA